MICYTAIYGKYEELKEPTVITPGWKYICYTDQDFKSNVWEIKKVTAGEDTPILNARSFKILFPWFAKSIWVDGSFTINCDLNEFWDKYFISPFTVVKHPMRNCVYAEIRACIRNMRARRTDLIRQKDKYHSEGMPQENGVIQSGILLREDCKEVRDFCTLWWEQMNLSVRDQVGFAYAEWKLGKWPRIKLDYRDNPYFKFKTHFNRR